MRLGFLRYDTQSTKTKGKINWTSPNLQAQCQVDTIRKAKKKPTDRV